MATSNSIIQASRDADLQARAVAIAAEQGVTYPQGWIEQRLSALACAPVNESGDTVASVYEYASTVRDQAVAALPPSPGANPAAVTDDYLRHAIKALQSKDTTAGEQG